MSVTHIGRTDIAKWEYADLVSFLVGNDYVNGETIRIDGAHRFGLK